MQGAHPHLLVNHFPIIGLGISLLAVFIGLVFRNKAVKMAGFALVILTSLTVLPANFTGEEAEESVEEIAGVSHDAIHEHEEFAEKAMILTLVCGAASLLAFWALWKDKAFAGWACIAAFVIGMAAVGMTAGTGFMGGKIRHTEIVAPSEGAQAAPAPEPDND